MGVESTMLALGTPAPAFSLPDVVSGRTISLAAFAGKPALLMVFICPHCPYVKHIQKPLTAMLNHYAAAGLATVAISSNDIAQYPEDCPDGMCGQAEDCGFQFPYCYDESQDVARAYQAACTPDFFLFDAARKLVYRGQFDGARPKNDVPVTGADLRAAIESVLAGKPVSQDQRPSLGCNIKWRPATS
jgi:peroxiredoxin